MFISFLNFFILLRKIFLKKSCLFVLKNGTYGHFELQLKELLTKLFLFVQENLSVNLFVL